MHTVKSVKQNFSHKTYKSMINAMLQYWSRLGLRGCRSPHSLYACDTPTRPVVFTTCELKPVIIDSLRNVLYAVCLYGAYQEFDTLPLLFIHCGNNVVGIDMKSSGFTKFHTL